MTRLQRLRDGAPDPLGRGVDDGFAIVVKDAAGNDKAWAGQVFDTEDAANVTAARCVPAAIDIKPVRRIWHFAGRPGSGPCSTILFD